MELSSNERLTERVLAMRDGIDEITVTEHSPDGLVTVVVDGRSKLLELELDPRIYRDQNADALAKTIMATVLAATESAEHDAARLVMKLMPGAEVADEADVDSMFDPALSVLAHDRGRR